MLCPYCGRFKLLFHGMEGTFAIAGNGRLLDKDNKYLRTHVHDGRLSCPRCGDLAYDDAVFEKTTRVELKKEQGK
jgi:hypothetical protein